MKTRLALLAIALFAALWMTSGCGDDGKSTTAPTLNGADAQAPDGAAPAATGQSMDASAPPPVTRQCTEESCAKDALICDPKIGCVECLFDTDCAPGARCDGRSCKSRVMCDTGADCVEVEGAPVCDQRVGFCVECTAHEHCGDDAACIHNRCDPITACINSLSCPDGQVCNRTLGICVGCVSNADCAEDQVCAGSTCEVSCASDTTCRPLQRHCHPDLQYCAECVTHVDCPEQYYCSEGKCLLDACQSGTTFCQDTVLNVCSDVGDAYVQTTCSSRTTCGATTDGVQPSCVDWVCDPQTRFCNANGTKVVVCSADGLTATTEATCEQDETCVDGACEKVICSPNSKRCDIPAGCTVDGGTCGQQSVETCNAEGTAWLREACALDQICDPIEGCVERPCEPDQPACDGNSRTVCNAAGTGYKLGQDCGDRVCVSGECLDVVCAPDETFCNEQGELRKCNANGTGASLIERCTGGSICSVEDNDCIAPVCQPGKPACIDSVRGTCNEDGSALEAGSVNCADSDMGCFNGECLPIVCAPSQRFCTDSVLYSCGQQGVTYTLRDTCSAAEYCDADYTYCQADKCEDGEPVCNGDLATTCADDGSAPLPGGTDCTETNQACDLGTCKDIICEPYTYECSGTQLHRCNSTGTALSYYRTCYSYQFCDDSSGSAVCTADVCSSGQTGCFSGEVISTCLSDGSGFSNTGTVCPADEVCTGSACAAQAVDTVSALYYANSRNLMGNFYRVDVARKLTQVEQQLSFYGTFALTWVIYEADARTGVYDLVYQHVVQQAGSGRAFYGSAVDFTLKANKFYMIGVHSSSAVAASYHYSYTNQIVSFGIADVGYGTTVSSLPGQVGIGSGALMYQRLTTVRAP